MIKVAVLGKRVKPERFAKLAGEFGAEVTCMIEDPAGVDMKALDVDGVIIVPETFLRPELVIKACEAGKHVFVEKPMAISNDDAYAELRAVEESGVKFFMSDPFVGGTLQYAKKAIDEGAIGKVKGATIRYFLGDEFTEGTEEEVAATVKTMGGGIMSDIGGHMLHMIYFLFGVPERFETKFEYFSDLHRRYGLDDVAWVKATYKDFDVTFEVSKYKNHDDCIIEIEGEAGTISDPGTFAHNKDIYINGEKVAPELIEMPDRHIQYWLRMIKEDISQEDFAKDPRGTCGLCCRDAVKLVEMRNSIYSFTMQS